MRVFVIRHGESETNQDKRWTGWLDVPLTEKGRADAALAREALAKVKFDKIYASDLVRAKCTAEIALPSCTYETTPQLREINLGSLAGMPIASTTKEQRALISKEGYVAFGGESKEAFRERVVGFMKALEAKEHQTVALFAHGGWLRTALSFVVGVELPGKSICCNNCTVAVFEYEDAAWRLHSWINLD